MNDSSVPAHVAPELERVYDGEVVEEPEGMDWEQATSEWAEGSRQEFVGQLRQARAAASVAKRYGWASMGAFAKEVGCGKSKVYDYARVWVVYGHLFEDGEFSARLETRTISHYVKALRAPDPVAFVEESEDEDWSTRRMDEVLEEREIEAHGKPERVETRVCPTCNGSGEVVAE